MILPNKSEEKKDYRFTGGDDFTGIYKLYHEVMMLNELKAGQGAYQVSYAEGNSGISFGGNQMDMSQDVKYAVKLVEILKNAKDATEKNIFTKEEVERIAGKDNANLTKAGESFKNVFKDVLPRIDAALSSDYGRKALDEIYKNVEVPRIAAKVEQALEKIQNPAAKKFYDSDLGRVLLFDFENQFKLQLDGPLLKKYIDGSFNNQQKAVFSCQGSPDCKPIVAPTDKYTIENHKEFIRSTEQYHKQELEKQTKPAHTNDCERRLNNIDIVMKTYSPVVEETVEEVKKSTNIPENFGLAWDVQKGGWKGVSAVAVWNKQLFNSTSKNLNVPLFTFYYDAKSKQLYYTTNSPFFTIEWTKVNYFSVTVPPIYPALIPITQHTLVYQKQKMVDEKLLFPLYEAYLATVNTNTPIVNTEYDKYIAILTNISMPTPLSTQPASSKNTNPFKFLGSSGEHDLQEYKDRDKKNSNMFKKLSILEFDQAPPESSLTPLDQSENSPSSEFFGIADNKTSPIANPIIPNSEYEDALTQGPLDKGFVVNSLNFTDLQSNLSHSLTPVADSAPENVIELKHFIPEVLKTSDIITMEENLLEKLFFAHENPPSKPQPNLEIENREIIYLSPDSALLKEMAMVTEIV